MARCIDGQAGHPSGAPVHSLILWVPVLPDDAQSAAETDASFLQGDQVKHLWDPQREVSDRVAQILSLTGPGWDLYLLYGAGPRWDGDLPPAPTFWMHQLSADTGANPALCLRHDPDRLQAAFEALRNG